MLHRLAQFAGAGARPTPRPFAPAREKLEPEPYHTYPAPPQPADHDAPPGASLALQASTAHAGGLRPHALAA